MRLRMKYLVAGWSIVTAGIILVSFQIMKYDFIKEDYEITEVLKNSGTKPGSISLEDDLFRDNAFGQWAITKDEFIKRIKNSERIYLKSNHSVRDRGIYLYLPFYGLVIWGFPALCFYLLGNLVGKGSKG